MSTGKINTVDNFSNRLDLLLKLSKTKKNKLAVDIRVTPQAITQMTKGKSNPSPQMLKALSEYFKVNEEWLEYGTGEKEKKFEVTKVFIPHDSKSEKLEKAYVLLNDESEEVLDNMISLLLQFKNARGGGSQQG
jgi:transcriptional regulator with XRE-family HTH domain